MPRRDYSIDIVRLLACFMVVLMHSPLPTDNAIGPFLTSLSYVTAPCIGLFFMVSGALLLPVKTDYYSFIRKRFSKIIVPTIIWSLIYIGLKLYYSKSEINLLQSLASIPLSAQGEGVLWFMDTLAGLYLIAPIISAWLEKATRREIEIILLLWAITLCYPIFDFWLITNTSTTGILYYFTGYAGYFILGFYLKRYPQALSLTILGSIAALGAILLLLLKRYSISYDFYQLFWYESIFIAAFTAAIWKIIVRFHINRLHSSIILLSNMTFGIYLIHILIMRHWLWRQEWIQSIGNYMMQTFIVAVLTFSISAFLCWIISMLPGSQWLIAYRKRTRSN